MTINYYQRHIEKLWKKKHVKNIKIFLQKKKTKSEKKSKMISKSS